MASRFVMSVRRRVPEDGPTGLGRDREGCPGGRREASDEGLGAAASDVTSDLALEGGGEGAAVPGRAPAGVRIAVGVGMNYPG